MVDIGVLNDRSDDLGAGWCLQGLSPDASISAASASVNGGDAVYLFINMVSALFLLSDGGDCQQEWSASKLRRCCRQRALRRQSARDL